MTLTPLDSRDSLSAVIAAAGIVYGSWGQFQPFADYTGILDVSLAGDLNGNGYEDIAIGAGEGGGPRVTIVDTQTREVLTNFFAYEPSFRGGVYVAVDGEQGELLVGAGRGGAPVVVAYDLDTFREVRRSFYGSDEYRGGVVVDADRTTFDVAPSVRLGRGALPIYLNLGDLTPSQQRLVVADVYRLFEPLDDLIHVTNVRPVGYQSDYLTAVRDDLSYYPVDVSGVTTAVYSRRQPMSHVPTAAYVSDLIGLDYLPTVIAHEVGHLLGLWHSSDPSNLMYAPAPIGGQFNAMQFAEMRSTISA